MLGRQRGPEIRIALAHPRQNLLLEADRQLAVRWPAAQPVNQRLSPRSRMRINNRRTCRSLLSAAGRFHLRQMPLLHIMQHFQSVPFSLAQCHALRFHGTPSHP